jgi:cobalamin biosynthesis protein CobT
MPKLERLELSGNQLTGAEVANTIVALYPDLATLKIAHNQITEIDHITPLKALSKLESLDVSVNPFCEKISTDKQEYQNKLRDLLQIEGLYLLDGHNKEGESIESEGSEEEEGEDEQLDSEEDDGAEESEEEDDEIGSEDGEDDGEASEAEETEDTGVVAKPPKKRARESEGSDGDKVTA